MLYFDHNATTALSQSSILWMEQAAGSWGNPSSVHSVGRKSLQLLEKSRVVVAEAVGAAAGEIVFTSGGSEANASVLLGRYFSDRNAFCLLYSPVEHASIRDAAARIESFGGRVHALKLLGGGALDLGDLEEQLKLHRPNLVSVMAANNETGIIYPIAEVSRLCRQYGALLHCDAVQALGKVSPELWSAADFASFSAHKLHGPKGVGCLWVRAGLQLEPTHFGGSQEIKRRGGTQNMMGIAGFAGALCDLHLLPGIASMAAARDHFESSLKGALEGVVVQGEALSRLPNTSNVRLQGVSAESLLTALDLDGICISAGSACSAGSLKPSAVLLAMGMAPEQAKECFRVSMGPLTSVAEVDELTTRVIYHARRIRSRRGRE